MIDIQKEWLGSVPWDKVLSVNQGLCQAQNTAPQSKLESAEAARQLWAQAAPKAMSLAEALDVCRHCHDLGPFLFNNGNTFAAISKTLVEDWMQSLPALEAQILCTTVCHYVAGQIGKKELINVLRHVETRWIATQPSRSVRPTRDQVSAQPLSESV